MTLSQIFYNTILGTVDKAVYQNVDAATLKFDTAYVELQKVVEQAMEIPVIEIREDIAELLYNSYKMFELNIMEKERIGKSPLGSIYILCYFLMDFERILLLLSFHRS